MISLKKRDQGFTIVELLIVIVVIGILALLVITTYSGIQSKARDAKRQSDLKSLQTQIEAFFSQNGYYPNLTDMNSSTWRGTNMKSLDANALVDPSTSGACIASDNCLGGGSSAVLKQYQYYATQSDGSTTCDGALSSGADQNCAEYKLIAKFENTVNGSTSDTLQNLD
jgi:prepilin-type N-terminal cleavage/methylation domain-containing protein